MPVNLALQEDPRFQSHVCLTAHNRPMLDQMSALPGLTLETHLDLMQRCQHLVDATPRVLSGMRESIERWEAAEVGVVRFLKTATDSICSGVTTLPADPPWHSRMSRQANAISAGSATSQTPDARSEWSKPIAMRAAPNG